MSKNLFSVNNGKITSNDLPISDNKKSTKKTDSNYYKRIYNDELAKQKQIRNQIDSDFYNQGVQTNTGYFSTQRNILPTQQQTEITRNKKFEVYNNPLQKNKEIENVFQTIKKSDEYKAKQKELTEQSNKVGYAKYDYDKSVVDNDKIGWLDKTLGTVVGGAKSIFDISGGLVNENGNTYYLPNQTELKQEKTQKSYDTKIGKLLGSAGYEMGKIGASTLMNQVLPGTGTGLYWSKMFIDGTNSAMQEGYDSGSAIAYGAVNTGFEYLTGKLLGSATKGLTGGKSSGYEELLNKVFNKILNKPKLANVLANAGSEATEEFIQEYLDNLSKIAILKKSKNIKDYTSIFTNKDVLSDAIYSALVGAITGGTIGTLTGEDTNVDNENVYEILTSELEDTKKDTDDKETINAIDNLIQSINDAKNGNININDSQASELESLITEYEEYEELKNQNKITQEQEQRMIKLQQQITQLQSQISENNANQNNNPTRIPTVNDIVNREATQKGNNPILPVGENINGNVVADNSTNLPIGDSIKASFNSEILPTRELTFLESAKANGINPDLKPIQDIDRMFKLRGIKASFSPLNTTQYGLYKTSTDIDGNRIRQVVLNPVAGNKQLIQETAVHELYHDLFSGRNATDMNKLIRTFNERYDDFAKARQALADAYARVYPEMDRNSAEFNAIIDEEVAANILARKLGNQEYINRLVHEEPSLARRIYNFVIDRLNKLNRLVGYKSERLFWEDVKNKFDKAYREEYKRNNSEAYTKYHTTENISSNIDKVLNDINERNPVKLRDYTPTVLVENGIKDLPMYENPAHIRKNILTEQQARNLGLQVNAKDHYHGLGKDLYVSVIDSLDNPRVIFKNKNSNNEFLILTMVKDNNNNNIIVPIEVETTTKVNNLLIDINRIKTIYGYDRKMPDLNKYIKDNINADKLEKIYEQKKNPSTDITPQLDSSKNNISQNDNNVKSDISTKYSIQENQNNTPELDNSSFSSAKKDYRGSHQIENANKITDLDLNEIKEKVIEANGGLSKQDYSDLNKLKKILNSPNETVKIYRASPVNELNDGDWVTTDKSYAKNVAEQNGGKVYEYEVKSDQLFYPDDVKSLPSLHRLSSFRYNDSVSNSSEIQGINVTKSQVEDAVYDKFDEMSSEYGFDIDEVMGVYLHGSRLRGTANPDSDLDAVVFYIGNESEDYIFNTINDDNNQLVIDGIKVDINPVSIDSLSEMDEYIERSEEYDKEVVNKQSNNDSTRYSQENSRWERYLDNHYKREGTGQTINEVKLPIGDTVKASIDMPSQEEPEESERIPIEKGKLKKNMNPNEISKLTLEDANTTPILPTRKVETGKGESKFASNIEKKTNMLSDSSKNSILSSKEVNYYKQVANEESLEKAFDRINNGGQSETFNWLKKDSSNATSVDVAEGWILLKQYQDAAQKETDTIKKDELNRSMVEVAKKMREIGTKAGQTVQAFNILNRLTPEGMVYYAQSELSEAYDKMVKNKTREWIDENREKFELTPEETQFIMDNMKEIQDMDDGYDKRVKLAEIQKLMTDKLPPEKGAKIKSWMRISMLFNPKTQVRNVAGNALIAPINYFGDLFSSYADKIISKKTGVRTTGNMNVKAILKGLKQGAYEATNDYKKGINTKDMEGNRFEISEGKSFSDKNAIGRALNRTESLLNYVMDVGDRVFSQASFENSLQNQMVLNNTTEITQDMIDIARAESLQRTWNDNNAYTSFVLNVRKGLNKLNINGYGLGDILIPFAKTPANLTKAIVDYSPVGLVKAISEGNTLKRSLTNGQYTSQMQHKFVQDLGKATAGTMLYVLGYALAKAKITSGKSDDDKDVANFLKNTLGISSYSIKIGNKSFTYDWAQPLAAPLSIMSNIATSNNKGQALMEGIVGSLDTAGAILLEQSFLQSINDVLTDNEGFVSGLVNSILDLPARAIPTFSKQIADMIDGTQRTSFEYDKPLETAVNKIKAKIPFVSRTLAPVVDTMGRDIQKYGGKNNIFNVFLNPANVNTENISNSAKEIYRLYKSTGETDIMPRVAPYYVNSNGEKISMTSDQRAKYQKVSGNIIEKSIKELLTDSKYKNMNDTEKADIINKIVNYSYNKAKEEVLNVPMSDAYNKVNMYTKDNGTVADYYLNKEEIDYSYKNPDKYKLITQITDYDKFLNYQNKIDEVKKTYTSTSQRKNAVINYVNSLELSIPQKAMLIKMNYSSFNSYDSQIINYINNQKLSVDEKSQILTKLGFKVKEGRVY